MNVAAIMRTDVGTVSAATSLREACRAMLAEGVSGLPVVDVRGALIGILTEGDVMRCFELRHRQRRDGVEQRSEAPDGHEIMVGDIMTGRVVTVPEDTPIGQLASILEQRGIKQVPVTRGNALVGIVTRADFLRAMLDTPPE